MLNFILRNKEMKVQDVSEGEAKRCPKCGGELEKGYTVALGVLRWAM